MPVIQSGWPVVYLCFDGMVTPDQFTAWLSSMSEVLARQKPFSVVAASSKEVQLPEGYRQLEAVWFKANKAALLVQCKGLARVADSPEQLTRLDSTPMHKAWPFDYFVTLDKREALQWAALRLESCDA